MLQIRHATYDDIGALIALGRRAHAESPRYRDLPYSPEKVEEAIGGVLTNQWALLLVAERGGELIGFFAGLVAEHFFSFSRYAADIVFYVTPEHRGSGAAVRLLREWERVLRDSHISEFTLGISSAFEPDRTRRLYERLGYKCDGYIMSKSVAGAKIG